MRMTNSIPPGCPLPLTVTTVNYLATLKVYDAADIVEEIPTEGQSTLMDGTTVISDTDDVGGGGGGGGGGGARLPPPPFEWQGGRPRWVIVDVSSFSALLGREWVNSRAVVVSASVHHFSIFRRWWLSYNTIMLLLARNSLNLTASLCC
jgi:hypothetical protein